MANRVVYVTGFPAVGKSTLTRLMRRAFPDEVLVVSYGELLMSLRGDYGPLSSLRESPASKVDEPLVRRADEELKRIVGSHAGVVLIESHAVTVERFGFRAIPFTRDLLNDLGLTDILLLFDTPERIRARTEKNPEGRPVLPAETIAFAQNLQASIAFDYSMRTGIPLHCLDMGLPGQIEEALTIVGLKNSKLSG